MYTIVDRRELTKGDMISITVEAPAIARKIHPGQFVVLRVNETGERTPLTVAYKDEVHGTITIIFQVLGKTTAMLASLKIGDAIKDLVGPLGCDERFEKVGTVVGIGGGSGIAVLHHILQGSGRPETRSSASSARARRGCSSSKRRWRRCATGCWSTTDDGSYGMHGLVTDALSKLVEEQVHIDQVIAVGPLIMMRAVCEMTRLYEIPTAGEPQPHHGRRHGHVRRLPGDRGRRDQVRLRRRSPFRRP